jgi:sodium-dependent phosphate cotransporter
MVTGIMAAMASDAGSLRNSLQLAFCHLLFNVTGILIFYPVPFMRFPVVLARGLGKLLPQITS